ncbi:MAG: uroporphyrinogen-III synthase [Cyanothece sp. SIO1E1]|nr:uroporphyrinogen-III synthase [Cyanothece sp. SIO1E1]
MRKNKHIFISRELTAKSEFRKKLLANDCTVEGESLVAFQGVSFSSFPTTDWLFFYSAKGAAYFSEGLAKLGVSWPLHTKIATIGKGTAAWLKDRGIAVDFIGSGNPAQTCDQFLALASGKSVLFPQALHSKKSIEKLAGQKIKALPLIVYENHMRDDFTLLPADVLTFTSPLNAQAYFKRYPEDHAQHIVSIGQTTSLALENMGKKVTQEAVEPNEICLAEAVLRCLA